MVTMLEPPNRVLSYTVDGWYFVLSELLRWDATESRSCRKGDILLDLSIPTNQTCWISGRPYHIALKS